MTNTIPQVGGVSATPATKAVLEWFKRQLGKADQVVEEWHEGANFYRKYSSGFIEQGGVVEPCPTNGSSVSLNIPFSSANYSLVCSTNLNSPDSAQGGFAQAKPVDASSFTVRIRADDRNWGENAAWHASGY